MGRPGSNQISLRSALGIGVALIFLSCSQSEPVSGPAPRLVSQQERPIRLMAVGDILLGKAARKRLKKEGYDYPFRKIKPLFEGADLIVGNLEAPITRQTKPIDPEKNYLYRMKPKAAHALKDFGMDLVCLANNHALDYGIAGMKDTQRELDKVGIDYFGAGKNLQEAIKGTVVEVAGIRIGFLAFMEPYGAYERKYNYFATKNSSGVAPLRQKIVQQAVISLRPRVDLLIAFVHWGKNYKAVTASQRNWGRRLATMGFDLVLGHHPHVVQGLEIVNGVPVLYSLGNFIFGTLGRFFKVDPLRRHGWVTDIRIEKGRITQIDSIPIAVDNKMVRFQPRPADPAILPRLLPLLQKDLGTKMEILTDRARWHP